MTFSRSIIRIFVLFLLPLTSLSICPAQHKISIEAGMGFADYLGDLKYTPGNPNEWGGAFSIAAAYHLSQHWEIRLAFNQGTIAGDDRTTGDAGRIQRNLHFKNNLKEISLVAKWNLLKEPRFQAYSKGRTHFTPYLFAGAGLLFSNPVAKLEGQWYELQPLGTEGQFIPGSDLQPYARVIGSFPAGVGLSYRISKTTLSLEFGYRNTLTDYLDDVSTVYPDQEELIAASGIVASQLSRRSENFFSTGDIRGNSKERDAYFFTMFRIGYTLGK